MRTSFTPLSATPVIRAITKVLVPFVLLFGLYVQFHGDFGPGGGFQAGVIFAAGFIVYGIVFGRERLVAAMPPRIIEIFVALGLLLYGGTGLYSLALHGNFLDYDLLDAQEQEIQAELVLIDAFYGARIEAARMRRAVGLLPTEALGAPPAPAEPAELEGAR